MNTGYYKELFTHSLLSKRTSQRGDTSKTVPTELVFQPDQPSCFFDSEPGVPFRGHEEAKMLLSIHIDTLKAGERFKTLLTGPAGTGKTTLAWIIANKIRTRRMSEGIFEGRFFEILPSQMETKADLDVFMRQLQPYDIVFIDEIHILRQNVGAEPLYHTLDDTGTPRYPLGDGEGWLEVPSNVSWIGATTEPGELDGTTGGALRRRLTPEIRLEAPSNEVLSQILQDQPVRIYPDASMEIARRSGGLPWQVLNIYHTAAKVAAFTQKYPIDLEVADKAFTMMGIDEHGLMAEDRDIIRVLLQSPYHMRSTNEIRYKMSESALCAAAGVDRNTYKQLVQPRLMRLGLLTTVGGQCLTKKAVDLFHEDYA